MCITGSPSPAAGRDRGVGRDAPRARKRVANLMLGPLAPGRAPGAIYSCDPGAGLKRMPRSASPIGPDDAASTVTAVQMMFVVVAAIAAVPWVTAPVFRPTSLYRMVLCVEMLRVLR